MGRTSSFNPAVASCTSLIVALVGTFASSHPAAAAVVSNAADVADAFVTTGPTNNLTGNNYGAAGALSVAAAGQPKGEFQSLMRFDLSSSKAAFDAAYGPGNWTIQSAALRLTAASPANPMFNASAAGSFAVSWMQNDAWAEGTGNPNAPTTDGVTFANLATFLEPSDQALGAPAFGGGTSGTTAYALDLPPAFAADLSAGGPVSLRLSAADSNVSFLFNSSNFGAASARPVLTVAAVPEPAAAGILAAGVLVIAARRSRRR
jgi:hypothetical protein